MMGTVSLGVFTNCRDSESSPRTFRDCIVICWICIYFGVGVCVG